MNDAHPNAQQELPHRRLRPLRAIRSLDRGLDASGTSLGRPGFSDRVALTLRAAPRPSEVPQ